MNKQATYCFISDTAISLSAYERRRGRRKFSLWRAGRRAHVPRALTRDMTRAMDPNATMPADAHSGALHAKIVTMLCLFIVSMLCGCLPLMISLRKDWFSRARGDVRSAHRGVVALLAFGGGVLFATTFMHLLPEIADNVKLLQGESVCLLTGIRVCCGLYFLTLILYLNGRSDLQFK